MRTMKTLALAAFAASALALAGCGGGGSKTTSLGDTTTTTKTTTTTTTTTTTKVAAAGLCADAACVKHYKDTLDAANAALAALLKTNYTASQKTAADKAVADAQKDYNDAVAALAAYDAKQPPTYALKAMATAMGSVGTLPTGVTAADGTGASSVRGGMVTVNNADGDNTWSKATWPIGKITGWSGNVWEKSDDSIVVHTNIQAKKGAKWSVFYANTAPSSIADGFLWQPRNTTVVTGAAATTGVLTLGNGDIDSEVTDAAKIGDLISAAGFPSGKGAKITYPDNDKIADNDFEVEFSGTFHGVAGKFKCSDDTACTAENDDKGVLKNLSEGWTFTPTSTDSMVADVRTDADYLDFGYWVNTDDSGDTNAYEVGTFFRGQQERGDVSSVTGKATYKGGAAGLYTKRAFAPGGDGDLTKAGRFTADAELTAYFAQDTGQTIAPGNLNSISGTIKNFMDGSQVIDDAWSLKLPKASITTSNGTFAVTDSWSGKFYGPSTNDAQPSGVAGKFTGSFDNGEVIGAFGATKQKQ